MLRVVETNDDTLCGARADTFHKPGFKMHARILHHLFLVAASDVIKVKLVAHSPPKLTAASPSAHPAVMAYVLQRRPSVVLPHAVPYASAEVQAEGAASLQSDVCHCIT